MVGYIRQRDLVILVVLVLQPGHLGSLRIVRGHRGLVDVATASELVARVMQGQALDALHILNMHSGQSAWFCMQVYSHSRSWRGQLVGC